MEMRNETFDTSEDKNRICVFLKRDYELYTLRRIVAECLPLTSFYFVYCKTSLRKLLLRRKQVKRVIRINIPVVAELVLGLLFVYIFTRNQVSTTVRETDFFSLMGNHFHCEVFFFVNG